MSEAGSEGPHKITLQDPESDSSLSDLEWGNFPVERFRTTWFVVSSSLPFWKNKKNVTITYSPIEGEKPEVLYDLVEYHPTLSTDPKAQRKRITGIDRPDGQPSASVQWKWRGEGLLMLLSSHWRPLGYHFTEHAPSDSQPFPESEWVITYFKKTLFTPAGVDIYARGKSSLSEDMKANLIKAIRASASKTVSNLADSMFDVAHD